MYALGMQMEHMCVHVGQHVMCTCIYVCTLSNMCMHFVRHHAAALACHTTYMGHTGHNYDILYMYTTYVAQHLACDMTYDITHIAHAHLRVYKLALALVWQVLVGKGIL